MYNNTGKITGPVAVTDNSFVDDVLGSSMPVLVDFWAPRCGPCRKVAPILEEIASEKAGELVVVKLDVEAIPATTRRYGYDAVRISNTGIFVHAAPWSVQDQGKRNVSHGCLNISPANAKWFIDNASRGDSIVVKNSVGTYNRNDGTDDWQR